MTLDVVRVRVAYDDPFQAQAAIESTRAEAVAEFGANARIVGLHTTTHHKAGGGYTYDVEVAWAA